MPLEVECIVDALMMMILEYCMTSEVFLCIGTIFSSYRFVNYKKVLNSDGINY